MVGDQWPKSKYLARRTCGLELNEYSKGGVFFPHIVITPPDEGNVLTSRVSSRPSAPYRHINEYTASITRGYVELKPQQKSVKDLRVLHEATKPSKMPPEDFEKLRKGKLPMLRPIWRGMNPYF